MINLKHFITLAILLWGIGSICKSQTNQVTLKSPDGALSITFRASVPEAAGERVGYVASTTFLANQTHAPNLYYEVSFNGKPLMNPSALGLELQDSPLLGENIAITKTTFSDGEDNYKLITGRNSMVKEQYKSVLLEITELGSLGRRMNIEARAYNDAVAFRYMVPQQANMKEFRLKMEKTEFRLATDAITWAQVLPNFISGYESEFYKLNASALANQGGVPSKCLVGLPLLMEMPGAGWLTISEADLEGNAAMYLLNPSEEWVDIWFETVLSPSMTNPELAVVGALPHKTAWRIIMAAKEPTHFIEANIMTNLNPECRINDTSWIMAGKSAWDWWNGQRNKNGDMSYTTETMKYYVDFAAESGLEFMLIDYGWNIEGDITKCNEKMNIPEVVSYAKSKGVKIFIWLHSKDIWNRMDEAFPVYEKWGVAGLKIDFVLRDDQAAIDWYYRIAEKAAKHKLMVDFHGCTKPWGLSRTFPNVVGYEAVLGMEQSKAGRRDNPDYRLVIPFTRMIGGPTDYTPGGFDNVTPEEFAPSMIIPVVMGTRAHHLAMYVVYEAPCQMVSDWPETYRKEAASFEFIKKVPATWDKTKVINGYPGEYITIARKRGNDWYLGAMTNWSKREYEISLDFLETGNYSAEIYADAPDADKFPKKINIKTIKVNSGGKLKINMATAGGIAVHFKRL